MPFSNPSFPRWVGTPCAATLLLIPTFFQETKAKVHFVKRSGNAGRNGKLDPELAKYFDDDDIEEDYGGTLPRRAGMERHGTRLFRFFLIYRFSSTAHLTTMCSRRRRKSSGKWCRGGEMRKRRPRKCRRSKKKRCPICPSTFRAIWPCRTRCFPRQYRRRRALLEG